MSNQGSWYTSKNEKYETWKGRQDRTVINKSLLYYGVPSLLMIGLLILGA
ncbi:hypothetical protein ACQCVK_02105 [Rossellomorea vietnamensis]|nr:MULTISPECIES: hypothetical protein [Rossellomorea]